MARPDPATGVRSVFAGRLGRTMTLIVLAILAIAGVALTFGSGKPRTKPREGRTIIAQQIGQTIATPAVSTFELTDCEPLESEELAATAPSR